MRYFYKERNYWQAYLIFILKFFQLNLIKRTLTNTQIFVRVQTRHFLTVTAVVFIIVGMTACGSGNQRISLTGNALFTATNVQAIPGDQSIALSWLNPSFTGNLTNIRLVYYPSGNASLTQSITLDGSFGGANQRRSFTLNGLINGQEYIFEIQANVQSIQNAIILRTQRTIGPNFDGDDFPDSIDMCATVNTDTNIACDSALHALTNLTLTVLSEDITIEWTNPTDIDLSSISIEIRSRDNRMYFSQEILAGAFLGRGVRHTYTFDSPNPQGSYTLVLIARVNGALIAPLSEDFNTITDTDSDGLEDDMDNCPFHANTHQVDTDGDRVGDACEAREVADFMVTQENISVTSLSWVNPPNSRLLSLDITYQLSQGGGNLTQINLTSPMYLVAGQRGSYQLSNLTVGMSYNLTIGGLDSQHGRILQNLPLAVRKYTPSPDTDGDGVVDTRDNCPIHFNSPPQADADNDGIGDSCEVMPINNFMVTQENASEVILTWSNPPDANLSTLSIVYGVEGQSTQNNTINILMDVLSSDMIRYVVSGLTSGATYFFLIEGTDFRDGRNFQPLPPERVTFTLFRDDDGDNVDDDIDNCPRVANLEQMDTDNDTIGNACEVEPVEQLTGRLSSPTSVELIWWNPAAADLQSLTLTLVPELGQPSVFDVTGPGVSLDGGALVLYEVPGLQLGMRYEFTISGLDARQGVLIQTLPPESINITLSMDTDEDQVPNDIDNCPNAMNSDQMDTDNDTIGDACEALAVTSLNVSVIHPSAVRLQWTNPVGSILTNLNVTYRRTDLDESNTTEVLDASSGVSLVAEAMTSYRLENLIPGASYTFAIGGRDIRHGDINQSLPPRNVSISLPPDADGDSITDADDNCPNHANANQMDTDNDTIGDACDVDLNNNGLRDINYLEDLASLRYDLNNDGEDDGIFSAIVTLGNNGCPINTGCSGYELMRDLDFSDSDSYAVPSNMAQWTQNAGWEPIGSCSTIDTCNFYTGVLEGNGYSIDNLFINISASIGSGLFAAFSGSANALNIRFAKITGGTGVGIFAGRASASAHINNVSVSGNITADQDVGGIVGNAEETAFNQKVYIGASSAQVNISAMRNVGGLVGFGDNIIINSSYANMSVYSEEGNAGGLAGFVKNTDIYASHATGDRVFANTGAMNLGGLVGNASGVRILSSFVAVDFIGVDYAGGNLSEASSVGGIAGAWNKESVGSNILQASYARGTRISGAGYVGGLIGSANTINISGSYVSGYVIDSHAADSTGGILGFVSSLQMYSSYAAVTYANKTYIPGGLFRFFEGSRVVQSSYWDNTLAPLAETLPGNFTGEGQPTSALQTPTGFTDVYADWDNLFVGAIYCDKNFDGSISTDEEVAENVIWNFRTASDYPAITCSPGGISVQP